MLTPVHRRYLLLEHGVGSGVFNFVLNALIAFLMFRGSATVPLWGQQSIGGDTIGTTFFLPFLTTLLVTRIAEGHVRRGRVPALPGGRRLIPFVDRLPPGRAARGAVLGLAGIVAVGLPAAALLTFFEAGPMAFWPFVGFKAAFAAVLGALVTPVIALYAIAGADQSA
jgi:hypothetical protein